MGRESSKLQHPITNIQGSSNIKALTTDIVGAERTNARAFHTGAPSEIECSSLDVGVF